MTIEATFFWWLVMVAISTLVGIARGQAVSGLVWGILFGPIGIVIVLFLPNKVAEQKANEARARNDEQMAIMQRTLAAQEEQLRLLRKMSGVTDHAPRNISEQKAEPKSEPDDFIPESLRGLKASRGKRD